MLSSCRGGVGKGLFGFGCRFAGCDFPAFEYAARNDDRSTLRQTLEVSRVFCLEQIDCFTSLSPRIRCVLILPELLLPATGSTDLPSGAAPARHARSHGRVCCPLTCDSPVAACKQTRLGTRLFRHLTSMNDPFGLRWVSLLLCVQ